MKLVIASDIHGSAFWCRKLLEVAEKEQPDHLILLGDVLYHGPRNDLPRDYAPKQVIPMLGAWAEKILCVRGNCEAEVDQMVLNFPCLAEYSVLMADGKTFYLFDQVVNGIRCLNPGSVSIPKDGSHSCMVYENGQFRVVTLEE